MTQTPLTPQDKSGVKRRGAGGDGGGGWCSNPSNREGAKKKTKNNRPRPRLVEGDYVLLTEGFPLTPRNPNREAEG